MFRKRVIEFLLVFTVFSHDVVGMDSYMVKRGDTLSEIVLKHTSPPPSVYGRNGRLEKILSLNPHIINPDFIKIGETVLLEMNKENIGSEFIKTEQVLDNLKTHSFDFGIGYGGKYLFQNQSGTLGDTSFSVLFLNHFSSFISYEKRNFIFKVDVNTYTLKYDSNVASSEKRLYSYELSSFYNNLFVGLTLEQQPLFNIRSNGIEMIAESSVLPNLGYKWDIGLSGKRETLLFVQTSVGYLLNSSTSNPEVKISNHKGFKADIKIWFARRLDNSKRYPIYFYWSNNIGYRDFNRSVEWGGIPKSVKSQHVHFNSTAGFKIDF